MAGVGDELFLLLHIPDRGLDGFPAGQGDQQKGQQDHTSKNPAKVARLHRNFQLVKEKLVEVEEKDKIRNWKNPITGDYVMEVFGIGPCNLIGQIKEHVKNAILDGDIPNTFEAADALMREKAAELGLKPVK